MSAPVIPSEHAVTRRDFIKHLGGAAGALALSPLARAEEAAAPAKTGSMPMRVLGRTGVSVSLFGLGTAAPGSGIHDRKEAENLINEAIDQGVNYLDTAKIYGDAELDLGNALGARRKDIFLVTKAMKDNGAEAMAVLENALKLLKTDHVDLLHIHSLGTLDPKKVLAEDGTLAAWVKAKEQGKTRFIGCTGHCRPGNFIETIETGKIDVIMVALNYVDNHTYAFQEKVLPVARKHNCGIVAMKVFGGAHAMDYNDPRPPMIEKPSHRDALRYALSLEGVTNAVIGVFSRQELREDLQLIREFTPMTPAEMAALEEKGKALAADAKWGEHFGPVA